MTREEILNKALEAVNGTRRENYGSVEDSFAAIAAYWSTYLNKNVLPKDVANMMILMKVARVTGVPGNADTYVDIAGYAACGGEIGYGNPECEEEISARKTPYEEAVLRSFDV